MSRKLLVFAVVISAALVAPVRAEKANLFPDQLQKTATHVLTGQVTAIYQRTVTNGDWSHTHFVAEIRVEECEKGDGVKKGDLVYVRYYRQAWIGKGQRPLSSSGHRNLPNEGESLRVYLARNAYDGFNLSNKDGGFNVIGANGFEKFKPVPEK